MTSTTPSTIDLTKDESQGKEPIPTLLSVSTSESHGSTTGSPSPSSATGDEKKDEEDEDESKGEGGKGNDGVKNEPDIDAVPNKAQQMEESKETVLMDSVIRLFQKRHPPATTNRLVEHVQEESKEWSRLSRQGRQAKKEGEDLIDEGKLKEKKAEKIIAAKFEAIQKAVESVQKKAKDQKEALSVIQEANKGVEEAKETLAQAQADIKKGESMVQSASKLLEANDFLTKNQVEFAILYQEFGNGFNKAATQWMADEKLDNDKNANRIAALLPVADDASGDGAASKSEAPDSSGPKKSSDRSSKAAGREGPMGSIGEGAKIAAASTSTVPGDGDLDHTENVEAAKRYLTQYFGDKTSGYLGLSEADLRRLCTFVQCQERDRMEDQRNNAEEVQQYVEKHCARLEPFEKGVPSIKEMSDAQIRCLTIWVKCTLCGTGSGEFRLNLKNEADRIAAKGVPKKLFKDWNTGKLLVTVDMDSSQHPSTLMSAHGIINAKKHHKKEHDGTELPTLLKIRSDKIADTKKKVLEAFYAANQDVLRPTENEAPPPNKKAAAAKKKKAGGYSG